MKVNICGVQIDSFSFNEVVEKISEHIVFQQNKPQYVVTPNAQLTVILQKDIHFREICDKAFLCVPDGVPLLWAAKLMNSPLKERVNGTDLFEQLCEVSAKNGFKVFLLGGRPQSANKAAQTLSRRHPKLNIVGTYCPPYGFEDDDSELAAIEQTIKKAAPDILFVGLGSPKQEKWIDAYHKKLDIPISIGIGASFEFVSGTVNRAPKWMQKTGLEWLFRLATEPRRLWKRYLIGNLIFVWLVLKQKLSTGILAQLMI